MRLLLFIVNIISCALDAHIQDPQFVIVICSFNNAQWYQANLLSALMQTYPHYRVIYIDDCSTDNTGELVRNFLNLIEPSHQVTLIRNKKRKLKMQNLYEAIHTLCKNHEIVVELDGDDFLNGSDALEQLAECYRKNDIQLTYGSYINFPYTHRVNTEKIPESVINTNSIRSYKWVTSHLKSYRVALFKAIPSDYLKINQRFVPMASDIACMFAMIELAGSKLMHCSKALYIYNTSTPINDDKVNAQLQRSIEESIRKKKPLTHL